MKTLYESMTTYKRIINLMPGDILINEDSICISNRIINFENIEHIEIVLLKNNNIQTITLMRKHIKSLKVKILL